MSLSSRAAPFASVQVTSWSSKLTRPKWSVFFVAESHCVYYILYIYILWYYTILYYMILYYIILYYTILYYIIYIYIYIYMYIYWKITEMPNLEIGKSVMILPDLTIMVRSQAVTWFAFFVQHWVYQIGTYGIDIIHFWAPSPELGHPSYEVDIM